MSTQTARTGRRLVLLFLILGLAFATRATDVRAQASQTYLLTAGQWGAAQEAAVAAAGGTVVRGHGATGIGVVTSDAPDFLSRALASHAFTDGAADPAIQWVSPNENVSSAVVTEGDETFVHAQWNIQAVDAPGAWATGLTGYGVRVAVVDGGIYNAHVDLAANVDAATSVSFVPGSAFNQDVGTFWHGTHVAGIIAAADNGIGTIGIAPRATIVGVKVLDNGSGSFGAVISGLLYACTPQAEGGAGADIVNMSLGVVFPRGGGNTGAGPLVAAMNKAVNFCSSRALVISAAGNDGLDLDHAKSLISVPAESGGGLAVSATGPIGFALGATNFRRPASYTNIGTSVVSVAGPGGDFVLPGDDFCGVPAEPAGTIVAPCWAFDMVMSTIRGSGASTASYGWAAGTSMAAPAVAAVAALIKERFPNISVGALKARLANSADDEGKKGADPFYGKGFVNARRAATE